VIRVAFISRATLYSTPGGDTRQVDKTAHCLRALGVTVDIYLTTRQIDYSRYDLLHFFNIIRPADIIGHIEKSGKPYVVSTIFVDYGSLEKTAQTGLRQWMNRIFSEDAIEYIKVIARRLKNGEKIGSARYLWWGHRRSVLFVATHAGMLLPNSENEYRRLSQKYHISHAYRVIPNGIDKTMATRVSKRNPEYENAVLCAARIERRKNQLGLIRALNNTAYQVFIPGKPSPNNIAYYEQCRAEADANIRFTAWLEEEELYEMYHSAKVHVLPSYFETTGLSSLEAAVMGCNIVVTEKGDTRDYFGDDAWYCDPDDIESIRKAVDAAYTAPYNEALRERILREYTWERAAAETLAAYRQVLEKETGTDNHSHA